MIKYSLSEIRSSDELKETFANIRSEIKTNKVDTFALVIDGETLGYVFELSMSESFREIAEKCEAVLCCRMSPSQKAEVGFLVFIRVENYWKKTLKGWGKIIVVFFKIE